MQRAAHITQFIVTILIAVLLAACAPDDNNTKSKKAPPEPKQPITLTFGGGPPGGTFNFFANKIASLITRQEPWMKIQAHESGGSLDNICDLRDGLTDFAILYSGDAFLGRSGQVECDNPLLDRFRAMAFLYHAPAQLVVRRGSPIKSVYDLRGRTLAVGNKGSGAAVSAERLFRHIGLWDEIKTVYTGYSRAAAMFSEGNLDAFWVLVGHPNTAVIEASTHVPIRLINLHEVCTKSGFYELYPFYSSAVIPAYTYEGQEQSIATFQDSAVWCVKKEMEKDHAYLALKAVFGDEGIKEMRQAHLAAQTLSTDTALESLHIPLHPGAVRFWTEQGKEIPSLLLP